MSDPRRAIRLGPWVITAVLCAHGCGSDTPLAISGDVATDSAAGADSADSPDGAPADPDGAAGADSGELREDADAVPPGEVTYHGAVRALLEAECVSCHTGGGIGPFPLTSWDEVEPYGWAIADAVDRGVMPPWIADLECRPVEYDRVLSAEQRATVVAWMEAGFPEGDPADYRPPDALPMPRLGAPDLTLEPAEPYQPNALLDDDYRCLLLDHTFDRETFVTAYDVHPGARELVHHVLVYLIAPEDVAATEARDRSEPGPGYTCFGGVGGSGGPVAGWVPGAVPAVYPEGSAAVIPAGGRLVMQVHYNTGGHSHTKDALPFDSTALELWTLPNGEAPRSRVDMIGVAQADFVLPAGEPRVEVTRSFTAPWTAEVIGTAPHMHTLGVEIRGHIEHRTGEESCVVRIPDWDFHWQQFYLFDEAARIRVRPGDRFRMTCVYDNSQANQPYVDGRQIAPRDVRWGEGTLDEMCLIYLVVTTPYVVDDGSLCGAYDRCFRACPEGDSDCFVGCVPVSGEDCADCVLGGLAPCVRTSCPLPGLTLFDCLDRCREDTLSCLVGECQTALDAVYDCVEPQVRSGACNDSLEGCGLAY